MTPTNSTTIFPRASVIPRVIMVIMALALVACGTAESADTTTATEGITDTTMTDTTSGDTAAAPDTSAGTNGEAGGGYPVAQVEMIVPWAPGGGTDTVARLIAPYLADELGTKITVVNREGGNSAIGNSEIAAGPGDGSMIGLMTAELAMLHWQGLTDITHEDVTPIGTVASNWGGIAVADDSSLESVEDLITYIEEQPGELLGSGTGIGGIWHVGALGMLVSAGLEPGAVNWVPSEGGAPAIQELLAGGIDATFSSLPEAWSQIDAGTVRPLAIMADDRDTKNFPDVPTLKEEGIDWSVSAPFMLVGPGSLEPELVSTIEAALQRVGENPEFRDKIGLFSSVWWDSQETGDRLADIDSTMGDLLKGAGVAE